MKRPAFALVAGLALLGVAPPERSRAEAVADEAADGEMTEQALVDRILRLRQALGVLQLPLPVGEGVANSAQTPDERRDEAQRLRREAEEFLMFLLGQPPEVLAEVSRLLVAALEEGEGSESGYGAEPPESPADEAVAVAAPLSGEREEAVTSPASRPVAPPEAPPCNEFGVFDTNGDGVVSGLDRYWRYFRLWQDDGDGAMAAAELSGLYDAGVREVTTRLGTFRTPDGVAGDVLGGGVIRLDLLGKKSGMATLVLDADRLARGGELELQDGSGNALSGLQALASHMAIASADGVAPLSCARARVED